MPRESSDQLVLRKVLNSLKKHHLRNVIGIFLVQLIDTHRACRCGYSEDRVCTFLLEEVHIQDRRWRCKRLHDFAGHDEYHSLNANGISTIALTLCRLELEQGPGYHYVVGSSFAPHAVQDLTIPIHLPSRGCKYRLQHIASRETRTLYSLEVGRA